MSVSVLGAVELDRLHAAVRRVPRARHRRTGADDREHPPTRGGQVAARVGRAGVDHVDAVERLGGVDPGDDVTLRGGLGVAGRGQHDGDRGTGAERGGRHVGERAGRGAAQERRERRLEESEERLGLGVAEAGVELDHPDATGGEREADVQQPPERRAAARHLVDRRLEHRRLHLLDEVCWRPRERRVGAHPAGVGALVAVADPLEVLGGLEGVDAGAVRDREEGDLRAVEVLLDHHPLAALGVGERGGTIGRDDDALAGSEAVVLDHVGGTELVQRRRGLVRRGAQPGRGGGHAGRCHHVLGERLGSLELRGGGRGAEAGDSPLGDGVRDPGDQRRLGTDDDQVHAELLGQRGDIGTVHRVDVVESGDGGDPGVARRGVHLGDVRVEGECPGQRVLAPAGADDEGLHAP